MITTRSPLRISLGGGGTDLPSYYREHGGFLGRFGHFLSCGGRGSRGGAARVRVYARRR